MMISRYLIDNINSLKDFFILYIVGLSSCWAKMLNIILCYKYQKIINSLDNENKQCFCNLQTPFFDWEQGDMNMTAVVEFKTNNMSLIDTPSNLM